MLTGYRWECILHGRGVVVRMLTGYRWECILHGRGVVVRMLTGYYIVFYFSTSYIYYCLFINFIGYSLLLFIFSVTLYYTGMFSDYPITNEISFSPFSHSTLCI